MGRPPQIFLNTTTGKKCPSDWQKWKGDVWYVKHDGALIYRMSKTGDWQARNGKNDQSIRLILTLLGATRSARPSLHPGLPPRDGSERTITGVRSQKEHTERWSLRRHGHTRD